MNERVQGRGATTFHARKGGIQNTTMRLPVFAVCTSEDLCRKRFFKVTN